MGVGRSFWGRACCAQNAIRTTRRSVNSAACAAFRSRRPGPGHRGQPGVPRCWYGSGQARAGQACSGRPAAGTDGGVGKLGDDCECAAGHPARRSIPALERRVPLWRRVITWRRDGGGTSVAGDTGSGAGPGTAWNRSGGADLGGTVARWCPSCGQPLPEESARFCVSCGTDVTAEQWPTADFPSPEPDPGWQPTAAPWEGVSSPPGQPTFSPPTFAPPPPQPTPPAWHSTPAQPWPSVPRSRGRPRLSSRGRLGLRRSSRCRSLRGRPGLRRRSPRRLLRGRPGLRRSSRVVSSVAVCVFAGVRVVSSVAVRVFAAAVRPVVHAADRVSAAPAVNPSQAAPRQAHRHRGRGRDRGHRRGYRHRAARAPWQPGGRRQQRRCPASNRRRRAVRSQAARRRAVRQAPARSRRSWRG